MLQGKREKDNIIKGGGEKRERGLSLQLFPLVRVILGRLVRGPVFLFGPLDTEGTDP